MMRISLQVAQGRPVPAHNFVFVVDRDTSVAFRAFSIYSPLLCPLSVTRRTGPRNRRETRILPDRKHVQTTRFSLCDTKLSSFGMGRSDPSRAYSKLAVFVMNSGDEVMKSPSVIAFFRFQRGLKVPTRSAARLSGQLTLNQLNETGGAR